jgi:filamentous hemagglutinin family protein
MNHAALNRIYRLVWSQVNKCWVAVAETAKGRGKSATKRKLSIAVLALVPTLALAGLDGGVIVGGQGTIVNSNLVQQDSSRLAINAQGFDVGAGEAFTLKQNFTTDMALIRVLGQNPSDILGSINAKGQLFISNPNGILFGRDSQINVGGLVGSSLDISRDDFMSGNYTFSNTGTAGSVVNQGTLTATDGGYIALLAPQVRNEGVIRTTMGTSLIGAGDEITLNISNNSLLSYTIDKGAVNALAENRQLIHADGGQVFMGAKAADALSTAVVNNTGIIKAGRVVNEGGVISLQGDYVSQTGTLDASGTSEAGDINIDARIILDAGRASANSSTGNGGNITYNASSSIIQTAAAKTEANSTASSGQGGTVHLQAGNNFYSSGTITATGKGSAGKGGTIDALGNRVVLAAATLDASGTSQGGLVRVGGDFHGTNPNIQNAQTTIINGATNIKADGGKGQVVVWSDDKTDFYGSISADKAGMIEVSSKGTLTYAGAASAGVGGKLLLDPANIIIDANAGPAAYELYDPDPAPDNEFGYKYATFPITVLGTTENGTFTPNGRVALRSWNNNLADYAGAVYLFDVNTGALISSLTGSQANDQVGLGPSQYGGITALSNGNFVVSSNYWRNGAATSAGAATWGSGLTGVSGIVSSSNSLVGTQTGDHVSDGGVTALTNGHYVVNSPAWNNGSIMAAGAATWGNGFSGTTGEINASNSLVGMQTDDRVSRGGTIALNNGNYVVSSWIWDNGTVVNAGAATWGNGLNGTVGAVSSTNSLVGEQTNDFVSSSGITVLSNGNYVVGSSQWDNGTIVNAGAATWINGNTGQDRNGNFGTITASNSLVGTYSYDWVSNDGITALTNGNYVVATSDWNGGRGAVTWGDGANGSYGEISSSNSLVGSQRWDYLGFNALERGNSVVALNNGHYVVVSAWWDNGTIINAGAVTWGNGLGGTTGEINSTNSLVGGSNYDSVGRAGVTALTNGNYVIASPYWNNGSVREVGAATWGSGLGGTVGFIISSNSLVGTHAYDNVSSSGITALTNGNYVVSSSSWDNGILNSAGAVTWGNGLGGTVGEVNSNNSLVGSQTDDAIGDGGFDESYYNNYRNIGAVALNNGNYVVVSPWWNNGSTRAAGAVTWGNGLGGTVGEVNANNSLVGTQFIDRVGYDGVLALSNGNYVIASQFWDNGTIQNVGAITWGNGVVGSSGAVTASNSIIGTETYDHTGDPYHRLFVDVGNGRYLISNKWANSAQGRVIIGSPGDLGFDTALGQTMTFNAGQLTQTLSSGTDVTLQASNDITVNQDILVGGSTGGSLTMQAGRNINLNADITTANGDFTAIAGDPGAVLADLQPGTPTITLGAGASINAGTGTVTLNANGGNFVNNSGSSSPITANQWFVYSTDPLLNTLGGMSANKHYNQTYTGSTPAYATNGNWLMYSIVPVLSVSPVTQVVNVGDTPAAFTPTFRGFIDGDTISTAGITGAAAFTVGSTEVGYHNIDYLSGLASSLGYTFANRVGSVDELIVMAPGTTPVTPPQPVTRPTIGANAYAAATNVSNNVSPTTSQFGNESFVRTTDAERPYVLTEVVAFERDASGAALDINALDFDGNGSSDEIRSIGKLELVLEDGGVHLPDDLLDSNEKKKSAIHKVPRVIRTKHML